MNKLGISPLIYPVDCREFHDPSLSPEELTLSLARQKMDAFLASPPTGLPRDCYALSADTIVHIRGRHLGKPADRNDAARMLRLLSGREHVVSTGFVLVLGGKRREGVASTQVSFHSLSDRDINFYLHREEWRDAAGGYKIQDGGEILINGINGSWSNVMGLPISPIYAMLRDDNYFDSSD